LISRAKRADDVPKKDEIIPGFFPYTDLPVTLLVTHSHLDHRRAAHAFDDVYMSELELEAGQTVDFAWKNVKDGDMFDLGGIVLEAMLTPGHTQGSICLLDRKNKVLYTGDAINKLPYIFSPSSTSIEEYLQTLIRVREMTQNDDAYTLWCGHTWHAYPYQVLLDSITACQEVLSGQTPGDRPYRNPFEEQAPVEPGVFEHDCGTTRLIYATEKIHK
jgi:glyoxylase-like metal-dependent hydrolase (beta-lactamase superfamily II)